MTNRALLYGNIVNENFFGGGTMNLAPFFRLGDLETLEVRRQILEI